MLQGTKDKTLYLLKVYGEYIIGHRVMLNSTTYEKYKKYKRITVPRIKSNVKGVIWNIDKEVYSIGNSEYQLSIWEW